MGTPYYPRRNPTVGIRVCLAVACTTLAATILLIGAM